MVKMKIHAGIDIAEVHRIKRLMDSSDRFLQRHFSKSEIEYCSSKVHPAIHIAGRLAAKEAAAKALSLQWKDGLSWKQITVESTPDDVPQIRFSGYAEEKAKKIGIRDISVSISHCAEYAVAQVIAISGYP